MAGKEQVRLGFVGVGGIARWGHLPHLSKWEDVKLAAFTDVNAEACAKVAAEFGAKPYPDVKTMLDDASLDAVYVCVPPFAHFDQELQVVERGVALFVEKPLATTLEKAREIDAAVRKKGVISAVGYNWRSTDITKKARELMAGKRVSAGYGYWVGGMPGAAWWRRQSQSGGQLVEQTTHVVDIALYLIGGKVTRVYAQGAKGLASARVDNHDIHDNSIVLLTFDHGAVCSIGSGHLSPQGFRTGLDLLLDGMTVTHNNNELRVKRPEVEEIFKNQNKPYEVEDRAFLDAIKRNEPKLVYCDYASAYETHRVTMAANESMESGKVVELK
ncbi:MAG: Gfo/Idh/MocA family oxidoreductase [Planctomycetota bacterium]|nr:Gfo/Idh/MocA family oxidoreductase [Planctomycetota bacterium]